MHRINHCLITFITFAVLLNLLPGMSVSYAVETTYTIQTGSFNKLSDAQTQYDSIVNQLSEKDLKYLRIEAIGNFYAVRIGKFEDQSGAEEFLESSVAEMPGASIMKAYFIEDRIIKSYPYIPDLEPIREEPELSTKEKEKAEIIEKPVKDQIRIISDLVDDRAYEKALYLSESALAARPEEPKLSGWHGAVLLKMKRPAEAIKFFRQASELSPDVSDYHSGIAYCLFFLDRNDKAIEEFNAALTLDPSNVDALAGLGVALHKAGEKDQAMDVYYKLKNIDRDTAKRILEIIEQGSL